MLGRWRVFMGFLAGALFVYMSHVSSLPRLAAGLALTLFGLFLRGWAAGYLEKGKRLAQDGPYAYWRHPLYAGSFIMALGFVLGGTGVRPGHSVVLWAAFLLLFGWVYPRRIKEEEGSLEKYFGDAWRAFTARNRRFLPTFKPFRRDTPDAFSWARYRKNREYQAIFGWLAGVALLAVKWMLSL